MRHATRRPRPVPARAPATSAVRHVLPRADYFELRALLRDVEVAEFDALKAVQAAQAKLGEVKARLVARFDALAAEHGFARDVVYGWDDQTCALIPQDGPK